MGDIVATEPVARHLRNENPKAYIIWCVNQKFADLVRYNPALDSIITVTCIAEWILLKKMIRKMVTVYDLHLNGRSCDTYKFTNKNPNKQGINVFNYLGFGSLLKVFSKTAGLENVEDQTPLFHFSKDKNDEVVFPFEYIVFHTLANDQERNWANEQWNALLKRILDLYPTIHVVEIGLHSILANSSPRFHNLTAKYNLQQTAHIIQRARLFVGVESGFGHFANALGTNSVIMFGYFQHYKNYQVYSGRFAEGKDVTLYFHQGMLRHLKMEEVWPSVQMRLHLDKHGEKLMRV
ncbi:glycosyltransferase family 9 protein [Flavitalea sp.]|nr:glycosyltransferase family 9 protein [Flavitalea sp.]